jgi:uncharacterized protein related to proFAR isomerase
MDNLNVVLKKYAKLLEENKVENIVNSIDVKEDSFTSESSVIQFLNTIKGE